MAERLGSSSYWPEDLLYQILPRLPVKSILRFKCVSKTWCSFLEDLSQRGVQNSEEEEPNQSFNCKFLKVFPSWLTKIGMNLTSEQRGDVDDKKYLMDEYTKAFYAAHLKKQQELSDIRLTSAGSSNSSKRQVGMKVKRRDYEFDDGVDWEGAPVAGNTTGSCKVSDLSVEAEASGDDEDDIHWEED